MKSFFLRSLPLVAVALFTLPVAAQTGNIAVNNDGRKPAASAILDVSSNYLPLGTAIQKGMLIPRMTAASRNALGAPGTLPQGLMVYQTDGVNGFYYVEYGMWVRADVGANSWDIFGNNTSTPASEFFGTTDNTDLVFKTNNTEAMRLTGSAAPGRFLGVGTTTPVEHVDVNGALRIYNTPPGSYTVANPGVNYSATNNQGVVLFRPAGDTLFSTYAPPPPQNADALMWAGHWGNQNGTGPQNTNLATATSGGWRKMENEYDERFTKSFTQQGTPTCVAGSVQIPGNIAIVAANLTSSLATPTRELVSPYPHIATALRVRHQHMYLASELNVELNQLGGNTAVTGGLCANQPLTSLGIYVSTGGATKAVPLNSFVITIKHAVLGVNNLSTGFDNSNDPAQSCYVQAASLNRPTVSGAWETFTPLSQPFVWDGVRNIIIEIAYATTNTAVAQPPILFGPSPGGALLTASWNAITAAAPCGTAGAAGSCSAGTTAPGGMPWNNATCGTLGTNGGTTQYRPVIQFTGTVATAPAGTTGVSSYLWYRGGLVVEATTNPPWGRQTTPYFSFKGPGNISVENGVYDNTVRLNDHVFDRAFDGRVKENDAAHFGSGRNYSIEEMASFTRMNRHLPTIKGRDSWKAERGFSLGDMTNQLWATAETQALYVTELNDRLDVLELLTNDRPLSQGEFNAAKASICGMKDHTESEKAVLLGSLQERVVTINQR